MDIFVQNSLKPVYFQLGKKLPNMSMNVAIEASSNTKPSKYRAFCCELRVQILLDYALETGGIMHRKHFHNTKKRRPSSFGFTLIELMVVIAIIGIVAVLAVPNFARMQREARIRGACQRTAQHFKQIRERAISTSGTYQITFPDRYTYQLTRPNGTTQQFRIGGLAGRGVWWGGAGVAGQPPEGNMGAPGISGIDFPGNRLIIDGRGGATNGVLYITNGRNNYAVGINRLGKVATYRYSQGTWN